MITVLFFAQTRELVGVDSLEIDAQFSTIEAIRSDIFISANHYFLWNNFR